MKQEICVIHSHSHSFVHFTAGLPDGVLHAFQGSDWETCVPLGLDGHDHGTEQVLEAHTDLRSETPSYFSQVSDNRKGHNRPSPTCYWVVEAWCV